MLIRGYECLRADLGRHDTHNVVVVPTALWSGAELDVGAVPSNVGGAGV